MSGGPLSGVRVVDLTTVVVGPICTRTLADYGADVIKVEAPGGDLLRTMAEGSRTPGMSGKFINFNRNKRSIVLDLKNKDGHAALLRLIGKADVFVSNVRPEALSRAGLDHKSLAKLNPRLIHCSILAFGRGGRYYNRPAYDPIVQSLSGVAGTIARATGEPRFVPMVMSDHTTGLIAAQCIGFALYHDLADVDALIAGLEKLIAKKRDLKQAAMQQLLTGQTRLPGFSGEWVKKALGDITTLLED